MSGIPARLGEGGAHLSSGASGEPSLKTILDAINAVPDWDTAVAVTTDTVTLPDAGPVIAVEGTTGNTPGPKALVQNGAPAVGSVDVNYDAAGIPTLTFNGTDAITVAAVYQLKRGDSLIA